jgi:hypothetical protein
VRLVTSQCSELATFGSLLVNTTNQDTLVLALISASNDDGAGLQSRLALSLIGHVSGV